jgi:hypothetical protein
MCMHKLQSAFCIEHERLMAHARCPSVADVSEALQIDMQFFFDFAKLADGDIELVTVITNAACIRYQLLGMTVLYIS